MKRKPIDEFLNDQTLVPVLDVRSPGEFRLGHIPGSTSLPLFSDRERAIIGTTYKQVGKKEAIKEGLDIVGPKMRSYVEQAEALGSDALALYCWRGGMRSESMAWLLERYGFKTIVLDGGYKAFRRAVNQFFMRPMNLTVLTGYTGSQKTRFLGMLREEGAQVIDLEGWAQHQGSIFGNEKSDSQPSTEHFQNLLFSAFKELDVERTIWVEDESFSIGRVNLPEGLFQQMKRSPHVFLEIDKTDRIEFLVEDYGALETKSLVEATRQIAKRLGYDHAREAVDLIERGKLAEAAAIILTYYDSRYKKNIERKGDLIKAHYRLRSSELPLLAKELSDVEKPSL
jgi:tRNA 2-selenouridine synthase